MDELAHCNRDTINPSLSDLGPIAEDMADDIRLSELDDIHIPVTAEPDLTVTSPSLDHPKEGDANEDTPATVISDDEDDDPISIREDEAEPTDVAHQINTVFNQGFDYDNELVTITDHRYAGGILELEVEYSTGEHTWHPISMVQDADPHGIAHYVMNNDLGKISNGKQEPFSALYKVLFAMLDVLISLDLMLPHTFLRPRRHAPVAGNLLPRQLLILV